MGGSAPTSTPVQVAPAMFPPGFAFSEGMFNQVFPSLLGKEFPRFPGSPDPGLSPTMAAVLRGGQTFAASPFSQSFNQAGSTLGGFQNVNYENPMASVDPNRYGFDYSPADFREQAQAPPPGLPASMQAAAQSMGQPMGGPPQGMAPSGPPSGAGAPAGGKAPQAGASGGPRSVTGRLVPPFPIEDPTQRDPRAPGTGSNPNSDPNKPLGPHTRQPSPGVDPFGDSGGGGGVGGGPNSSNPAPPNSGPQPPGGGLPNIPKWLVPLLGLIPQGGGGGGGAPGSFDPTTGRPNPIDLGFTGFPGYEPIKGGEGFVDYNPGSNVINIGPGMTAGSYGNPMPPGPFPGSPNPSPGGGPPPSGQPPGGGNPGLGLPPNFDPGGVVPGNQLTWFGRNHGVNKGKSLDEVHRDMYERGWDFGPNFQKPEGWGERGSKQTTWAEVARMPPGRRNPGSAGAPAPQPAPGPPVTGGPVNVTSASQSGAPMGGKVPQ